MTEQQTQKCFVTFRYPEWSCIGGVSASKKKLLPDIPLSFRWKRTKAKMSFQLRSSCFHRGSPYFFISWRWSVWSKILSQEKAESKAFRSYDPMLLCRRQLHRIQWRIAHACKRSSKPGLLKFLMERQKHMHVLTYSFSAFSTKNDFLTAFDTARYWRSATSIATKKVTPSHMPEPLKRTSPLNPPRLGDFFYSPWRLNAVIQARLISDWK